MLCSAHARACKYGHTDSCVRVQRGGQGQSARAYRVSGEIATIVCYDRLFTCILNDRATGWGGRGKTRTGLVPDPPPKV